MPVKNFENKPVAVLGYGLEGEAAAKYLLKHRQQPVLFDERPWEEWPKQKQEEIKALGVNFIFGPDAFLELRGFESAFRSPGIPIGRLKDLKIEGLKFTSQTKFFFDNCPCKIIGITGTKGKGTTASLIYEIVSLSLRVHPPFRQAQGGLSAVEWPKQSNQGNRLPRPSDAFGARNDKPVVYLTGNIGKIQPLDILDDLKADDWVVYELSSFQLQDLDKSPHIGVVLMTTSEHLDYHKDDFEYLEAKSAITKFQSAGDVSVVNADYPASVKIGSLGDGQKIYFSGKNVPKFIDIASIKLRGAHNLENICAAAAAAKALDINEDIIKEAVTGFKGLEHRLEFVGEKQGIKFYNDSFSTTPETAIAAIKSFDEPLIVVLGGSGKKSDFTNLGKTICEAKNIKALVLIGGEASSIKQAVTSFLPSLKPTSPSPLKTGQQAGLLMQEGAKNMDEIFAQIRSVAAKGDVVLLSPACASFGMFKNYKDRGEQFKIFVQKF